MTLGAMNLFVSKLDMLFKFMGFKSVIMNAKSLVTWTSDECDYNESFRLFKMKFIVKKIFHL
jgi:hypothetical protein